jgi:hypothetical protein
MRIENDQIWDRFFSETRKQVRVFPFQRIWIFFFGQIKRKNPKVSMARRLRSLTLLAPATQG